MQVKFKRHSEKKGGLLGSSTAYVLEAMLMPSAEEEELITRFNYWDQSVWMLSDHAGAGPDPDMKLYNQLVRPRLGDLKNGYRVSFDSFNLVYRAESVIIEAAQNAIRTVEGLATFNGEEQVWEVTATETSYVTAG